MSTLPKTSLQAYGEFFYIMLKYLADPNCKHCHGRGYVGVQVGTGKKQGTGWEVFCHGRGCVGKTLAKYHEQSDKAKAQRAKEATNEQSS